MIPNPPSPLELTDPSLSHLICDKDVKLQQPFPPLSRVDSDPLSLPNGGGLEGVAGRQMDEQLNAKLVHFVDNRYLRYATVDSDLHVPVDFDRLAKRLELELLKSRTDMLRREPTCVAMDKVGSVKTGYQLRAHMHKQQEYGV